MKIHKIFLLLLLITYQLPFTQVKPSKPDPQKFKSAFDLIMAKLEVLKEIKEKTKKRRLKAEPLIEIPGKLTQTESYLNPEGEKDFDYEKRAVEWLKLGYKKRLQHKMIENF